MGTFEGDITAAMADIVALIPRKPAAALGRHARSWQDSDHGSRVRQGLHALDRSVVERLHGSLELAVPNLTLRAPAEVADRVGPPPTGSFAMFVQDGDAKNGLSHVEVVHPGATDVVVELVESLRDKAFVADACGDEEAVMAAHGAAHLALAVAVSAAVLRAVSTPSADSVIGVALGAAAAVIPDAPKPPAYEAALLEKRRAEYGYGTSSEDAAVTGHRFWLSEGPVPDTDFSGNGLAVAVPGGIVVRTGVQEGAAPVWLRVSQNAPVELDLRGWDEVVELSWTATTGGATLSGTSQSPFVRRYGTPPWPGEYRALVSASGRDGDFREHYEVRVWRAPFAPDVVHKRTDRLGHQLRGEPEPLAVTRPEARYKWISDRWPVAATVTFVTGAPLTEVVARSFGASLAGSEPVTDESDWSLAATVLGNGLVVVVENNHYRGSHADVLQKASKCGRAASMYWNVNAVTRLSFAHKGKVLASEEPGDHPEDDWYPFRNAPPEVRTALQDIDFTDYRDKYAKGVTAALRFVGGELVPTDLDRLTVYPIAE